jgi:hypothetical protein
MDGQISGTGTNAILMIRVHPERKEKKPCPAAAAVIFFQSWNKKK